MTEHPQERLQLRMAPPEPEKLKITYSGQAAEAIRDRRPETVPSPFPAVLAKAAIAAAIMLENLQMQALVLCGDDAGLFRLVHEEAARRGQLMENRALRTSWYMPDGRIEGLRSVLADLTSGRLR